MVEVKTNKEKADRTVHFKWLKNVYSSSDFDDYVPLFFINGRKNYIGIRKCSQKFLCRRFRATLNCFAN